MTRLILLALALPACIIEDSSSVDEGGTCGDIRTYAIDTGSDITHEAGVDAGYYISYAAGGAWHIDWTCDTKLSALGCEFSGAIHAPALSGASCFQCEDNDAFSVSGDDVTFDMLTSTGLDGVDFHAAAGQPVELDLYINGIYQPDLVFLPASGVETPACLPIEVAPTAP